MAAQQAWCEVHLDSSDLRRIVRPRDAVEAIGEALREGLDPADTPARGVLDLQTSGGQILTMPSDSPAATGIKIATLAPDNPDRGLPRIQGVYILFDPVTLSPLATIDGAALTTLRTPAVSVAAVLPLLWARPHSQRVVVLGAGPQGAGHVATLRDVGVELAEVTYVVRHPERVELPGEARVLTPDRAESALARADVVVCATTSEAPVFDSTLLQDDAVVMAVGSHQPHVRELDAALMGRSQVIVEDEATALRENGDVVLAIEDGTLTADRLVPMARLLRDEVPYAGSGPVVFTGSGMSWEDLVVAHAAVSRHHS